jgi:D-alanine-D-alanine ligase
MSKVRVGVLRGGPSREYQVSLDTGASVLKNLPEDIYHPHDILIDKSGVWHIGGLPVDPHKALSRVDVIFNALHGEYGEDGKVQQILDTHGIPYTGSQSLPSAIGMNKSLSKKIFRDHGLKTPHHILIEKSDLADRGSIDKVVFRIFRSFPVPAVVKPVASGSSVGVSIVRKFEDIESALNHAFEVGNDSVMVEEYIPGTEATVGVVDDFRGASVYALPPIEIRPHGRDSFFDYDAKYGGKSDEIVPGNFSHDIKHELMHLAIMAHQALGARHYSRSDFMVSPRRGIYILETNTLPGLTDASLLPKALHAVGAPLGHFLDHVIRLAMGRR